MIEIPTRVLEGELADDWYPLSGRQGDEKEGVVNLLLEYRVQQPTPAYTVYPPMMLIPQTMPAAQVMYTGKWDTRCVGDSEMV
jgi:toll-interacting protein